MTPAERDALIAALADDPKKPAPQDPVGKIDQLIRSPFADSVQTVTGKPAAVVAGMRAPVNPDLLGEYAPSGDSVYLTPTGRPVGRPVSPNGSAQRKQPEYTLAHEMAHHLAASNPSVTAQQDSVYAAQPLTASAPYWQQSPSEHYAEAFANAITALRQTASQPGDPDAVSRSQSMLEQAERRVPGTQLLMQQLLQHPLYAHHPLNQATQLQAAPRDVTVVRRP